MTSGTFTAEGTVAMSYTGSAPPAGSRLNFIVTAGNVPCEGTEGATALYYVHADHLNTPRALVDAQNRVVWRWDSDPFGVAAPAEDPDGDGKAVTLDLRFPGQYFDRETNLHYNYFRDYDPQTGRYVQADPIGVEGAPNRYAYADNIPSSKRDPLGLIAEALPVPRVPQAALGSLSPAAAVAVAGLAGYAAGTAMFDVFGVEIVDLLMAARGRWTCTAKCNHEAIPPNTCCDPPRLTGSGQGHSQEAACRAAKRAATTSAAPGCYGRHCRCDNCWKN
jgi:RHS repeat-associated protein